MRCLSILETYNGFDLWLNDSSSSQCVEFHYEDQEYPYYSYFCFHIRFSDHLIEYFHPDDFYQSLFSLYGGGYWDIKLGWKY